MQQFGVIGIGFEGSPAARLGLKQASGAQLGKQGVMDAGGIAVRAGNHRQFVFSRSPLPTVHLSPSS